MPSVNCSLTYDDLLASVESELFAAPHPADAGRIGIELELFAADATRRVPRMLPLDGTGSCTSVIGLLKAATREAGWEFRGDLSNDVVRMPSGGRITLEPAGQIEYSGPPLGSAAAALADLEAAVAVLESVAAAHGVRLVANGFDRWTPIPEHVLAVPKARYRAMDQHFARIGPFGRLMMRATAALQINLDFGTGTTRQERWRLANMIAPALNAVFANAPFRYRGRHYHSFRYEIWRQVDPSRTGRLYDRPDLDPVADYLRFALDAEVMFIGEDHLPIQPPAALTFRRWMAEGHCNVWPTLDDWRRHLTTLFPDVRARGFMEIRAIDALPAPWRGVAVAVVEALLYDARLRRRVLEVLERRDRRANPADHEHGGFWTADFAAGRELVSMAIDSVSDPQLAATCARFHDRLASRGVTPGEFAQL